MILISSILLRSFFFFYKKISVKLFSFKNIHKWCTDTKKWKFSNRCVNMSVSLMKVGLLSSDRLTSQQEPVETLPLFSFLKAQAQIIVHKDKNSV